MPLEDAVAKAVREVRAEWQRTLPIVVDTTRWTVRDGLVTVDGGVLTMRQADDYVAAVGLLLQGGAVSRPALLSDPGGPWTDHRWVRISGSLPIDLVQRPGGELQNQWRPPAWLRLFAESEGHSLVQLPDGTLGWVSTHRLDGTTPVPPADPWLGIRRAREGAPLAAAPQSAAGDALSQATRLARSRLGRPYLWGGNLPEASDCSGFVQSVMREAADVLLPKNTRDQRRLGSSVEQSSIEAGDLVFVRGRELGLQHVGLALRSSECEPKVTVIHASMSRNTVLEEGLSAFLQRHDYVDTRRVVDWRPTAAAPSSPGPVQ